MFFMGRDLRTDNCGIVTQLNYNSMGVLLQVEILTVEGERYYLNANQVDLEQKGEL